MTEHNYFIKPGYRTNEVHTSDAAANGGYWNRRRIASSRSYQFPVYRYASELIHRFNIGRCIDVGCGPATKLAWLHSKQPHVDYVGIDQPSAIDYCKRTHSFGTWHVEDFDDPASGASIQSADLVICADVIEHLSNPDSLLRYLRLVADPDGYILLSTPERDLYRGQDNLQAPNKFHVREWNADEFRLYVQSRGFKIQAHELQYPVRFGVNRIFYREIISRAIAGHPLQYNQVWLLRPA